MFAWLQDYRRILVRYDRFLENYLVSGSGTLTGTDGNDLILGSPGADIIDGNGGNDCIVGGGGDDSLNGNNGNDVCLGGLESNVLQVAKLNNNKRIN